MLSVAGYPGRRPDRRFRADILLFTDSAPGELAALQAALHTGRISAADADPSYRRILALKHKLSLV